MNNQFDELTKAMAQSVTRRAAIKKFGLALAGMALACFGLAHRAEAGVKGCLPNGNQCRNGHQCCSGACGNGTCCLAPLQICGTGFSIPDQCLTDCCSHTAVPRRGGFDRTSWVCT